MGGGCLGGLLSGAIMGTAAVIYRAIDNKHKKKQEESLRLSEKPAPSIVEFGLHQCKNCGHLFDPDKYDHCSWCNTPITEQEENNND